MSAAAARPDVGAPQRDAVIATLRAHQADLRQLGASQLFLFGSTVRNEAGAASDVDLFMEFDNPKFSLIDLLTLQYRLEDVVHRPVDLMTRGSLHPRLRGAIEQSAIQVY